MKRIKESTRKIVLSALFLALGFVLPLFTGQIPHIGSMFLPMHIPVFLCGMICGGYYGGVIGFILPIMRSLIFTVPVIYPNAIAIAFELYTYGLVSGLLSSKLGRRNIFSIYASLISAMICGRAVRGVIQAILLGIKGGSFTMKAFLGIAFFNAVPGIIIQLVVIPLIISIVYRKKEPI